MVSRRVTVNSATGLHLRPAGALCREAIRYRSRITISYEGTEANAKSVLSVLSACVKCGEEITLICDGEDEEEALAGLVYQIEHGLEE